VIANNPVNGQDGNEPENMKSKSYFETGIALGMPAFLNLVLGYSPGPFIFHLSGMYYRHDENGLELHAGYNIKDNTRVRHTLGLSIAHSQDTGTNYYYAGPVYQLNYRRLYLETGFGRIVHVSRGEFENPYWLFLQVGYVYRFLPK
jgi:hypothetical protein